MNFLLSEQRESFLMHLLAGDRARCQAIVETLLAEQVSLKTLYVDLFQHALYRVGREWEMGRISVATEHLATSIVQRLMSVAYPRLFRTERVGRRAVVSCTADEYHQLGGQMVADHLETRGWDCDFLGANTPVPDLVAHVKSRKPELVGLSISIYFNLSNLVAAIDALQAAVPDLPILVGGQALNWGDLKPVGERPGVTLVRSLDRLDGWLDAR